VKINLDQKLLRDKLPSSKPAFPLVHYKINKNQIARATYQNLKLKEFLTIFIHPKISDYSQFPSKITRKITYCTSPCPTPLSWPYVASFRTVRLNKLSFPLWRSEVDQDPENCKETILLEN
jgi:hypothetical protein